ncbi:MAG TPA: hypothetical protein VHM28_05005 [Anaerolineales bacterium]|jgi:hypothetical protein|nr:hypothetical protein [Anaerolineales bacterium]
MQKTPKAKSKYWIHPVNIPLLIINLIMMGVVSFLYLSGGLKDLTLDLMLKWFVLLFGISFILAGIIGIRMKEMPARGEIYYQDKAIGMGAVFIVFGLMCCIIFFYL